jgi:hypothetical protein
LVTLTVKVLSKLNTKNYCEIAPVANSAALQNDQSNLSNQSIHQRRID